MVEKKQSLREIHSKLMGNPELDEEHHADAFINSDNLESGVDHVIRVNNSGIPVERVNVGAYANDYAGFWRMHERKLWAMCSLAILYLALKLFGA